MTRPPRPRDYDLYDFRDDRKTVFPYRRILSKPPAKQPEEIEIEILPPVPVEKESKFIKELFQEDLITVPPLVVDYTTSKSLIDMFSLNKPSIRSFFEKGSKPN